MSIFCYKFNSFLLLFQLTLSTYSREGCHKESALDLIFLLPFLSQDFSVVTSEFDVTHGWITSIIPSFQLYVLVLFSQMKCFESSAFWLHRNFLIVNTEISFLSGTNITFHVFCSIA